MLKPLIEMPSPADLRLEAACAKRNPYAYQAQSGTDPCARFARATSAAGAAATDGSSNREWASRIGAGLVVVAVAVAAAWAWRRQRARRAAGATGDQAGAVEADDGDSVSVRAPA
jgi:cobalamin synthase